MEKGVCGELRAEGRYCIQIAHLLSSLWKEQVNGRERGCLFCGAQTCRSSGDRNLALPVLK